MLVALSEGGVGGPGYENAAFLGSTIVSIIEDPHSSPVNLDCHVPVEPRLRPGCWSEPNLLKTAAGCLLGALLIKGPQLE